MVRVDGVIYYKSEAYITEFMANCVIRNPPEIRVSPQNANNFCYSPQSSYMDRHCEKKTVPNVTFHKYQV